MFETNDMAKMQNPPPGLIGRAGGHFWSHVTLKLEAPWFHIAFNVQASDGSKRQNVIFVTDIRDLVNINNDKLFEIEQVYLVSPERINKNGKWMMEPVSKILAGLEPEYDLSAYIYVLENGNRYMDSDLGTKEQQLKDVRPIYTSRAYP